MLDRIVVRDSRVTRRENQLDQLCNVILLKLESDKQARLNPDAEVSFKAAATDKQTGDALRAGFNQLIDRYPESFSTTHREELEFSDQTLSEVVEDLAPLNLLGVSAEVVSVAFQVLRSAALKQKEGQYFTPRPVIRPAILAAGVDADDLVLDPASGTGGFVVEAMAVMRDNIIAHHGDPTEISRWAQKALHGIDKDSIAVKLTRAVMQIMGDGSANCAKGDSIATHRWATEYPHLVVPFRDRRFSKIFTNPPFGQDLTISRSEAAKAKLTIAEAGQRGEIEIGLAMLDRCYKLLRDNGHLCIVLPETYFFSPSYKFVRDWCRTRFVPEVVINVPMEAFQGFCRAKTNVYVFRRLPSFEDIRDGQKRKAAVAEAIKQAEAGSVTMLNPRTCGIYKSGAPRYKIAPGGIRTSEIDNEMLEHVMRWRAGLMPPGGKKVTIAETITKGVLVPTYYDPRYDEAFDALKTRLDCGETTLGKLIADGTIDTFGGHGSPGNDVRIGSVPYIKVSDIRALRVNVNPTNLVPRQLARKFWRGEDSGLQSWDLITPNRASANIGEFAILLPGEQDVVLTKEMLILRVAPETTTGLDTFYLLWALSLRAVRDQWRRIALMQTNREDLGARYREIRLPWPKEGEDAQTWIRVKSMNFRAYFEGIAIAKTQFMGALKVADEDYIASVFSNGTEAGVVEAIEEELAEAVEIEEVEDAANE
jgi:type I restriction enzyme M protein